jgi:methylenetetrahydrofolate reductase (NADPH)
VKTFREAIRTDDFVITVQLPLTPGTTADEVRDFAKSLRPVADAIQISDNSTTVPHMSPLAAASLAIQSGMDPVVQLSCRDRNRIALQSDLMGAAALGVTSLLLTRGEKLPAAHKQRIKGVFDIGAQRLMATAQAVGANERLVTPPGFFLGSHVTVIDPPADWPATGVGTKAGAGSKFVQTQPCLDLAVLGKYMAALGARKALERISVIVQVPLLASMGMIGDLQGARRPLLITPQLVERLEQAGEFAAEAEAICVESLQAMATIPGVSGANVVHRGEAAAVARVITAAFGSNG